jgi:signal transduction histidine kinase
MDALDTRAVGIAHDLRNLLTVIQGDASLVLLDMDSSHPHYERLKSIEQQVESATELIGQLLQFTRGGKYKLKPADLNDLIQKSSAAFARTKKGIKIHEIYETDLYTVEVDHGQIERVFLNLYMNAWQAMPEGGDLSLETKNITLDDGYDKAHGVEPGRYVKVSVTDSGVGMDEATQKRVFEPFFTTNDVEKGVGLGLASAYGIIKNHRGAIDVSSKKGGGTTFNIFLPASEKPFKK